MDRDKKVELLVEEWKQLASYIEQSFHSLERYSLQAVVLVGLGAGVLSTSELPIDHRLIWPFIAPLIFVLLFRLQAQLTFSYFQARRVLGIEEAIRDLESDTPQPFQYAHRVRDWIVPLRRSRGYSYVWWIVALQLGGVLFIVLGTVFTCRTFAEEACRWQSIAYICSYIVGIVVALAVWMNCVYSLHQEVKKHLRNA